MEEVSGTPRRNWKGKTKFDLEDLVVSVRWNWQGSVSRDGLWWRHCPSCDFGHHSNISLSRPEEGQRKRLSRVAAAFAQTPRVSAIAITRGVWEKETLTCFCYSGNTWILSKGNPPRVCAIAVTSGGFPFRSQIYSKCQKKWRPLSLKRYPRFISFISTKATKNIASLSNRQFL